MVSETELEEIAEPRTAEDVIRDVHALASEMDAIRQRVDRSGWDDSTWIEVGYGCGEILVRTSDPNLRYRAAVDRITMDDVIDLIESLLDKEGK